jgi:hypothetical protein
MAQDPKQRVLIVAPATALAGVWAKTIQQTCPGKSMQVIGMTGPGEGEDPASYDWTGSRPMGGKRRAAQSETPADFNIIGFDALKSNPQLVASLGHTIVIADEAQYAKNPRALRHRGLVAASGGDMADPSFSETMRQSGSQGVEHRWGITGTILEKNLGEMFQMMNWAKPGHYGSQSDFERRFGILNQFDELTGQEKVQQFCESCADGAFFQSPNTSSMPPFPELQWDDVKLSDGHKAAIQEASNEFTEQWKERHEQRLRGVHPADLPKLRGRGRAGPRQGEQDD